MGDNLKASQACLSPRRVLIAANPYSGYRSNERRVEELAAALAMEGLEAVVAWSPADRRALLADLGFAESCCCVIAAGGDGTVADLINDCPPAPIAVFPLGNENLFAREFGFRRRPRELARRIAAGRVRTVDLGRANGRRFCLMVGVGFDAAVVHRVAAWRAASTRMRRITNLSYVGPTLVEFVRYAFPRLTIEADGQIVEGAHALVFNLPRYGLNIPLCPVARGDDGKLNWVVLRRPGRWKLLAYAASVAARRHLKRSDVVHGTARQIRIVSATAAPVQIDGDPAGFTPLELEVLPRALQVIV